MSLFKEPKKKKYSILYTFSRNGKSWNNTSTTVKAISEDLAKKQVESKYPYVKDIRITSVR